MAVERGGLPEAGREGKVQEALLPLDPTGEGQPPRQRLRRLPLDGQERPAVHREDRDAVGDWEREHDGEGEVVLPSRRDRDLRKKI